MGLLAVPAVRWDWPVVAALASLLESLNPEMPFDASPPSRDEYLSRCVGGCVHHSIDALVGSLPIHPFVPPWITTAHTRWYLHPTQHAAEMLLALVIFGPLLMVTYKRMVAQMRANK